MLVLRAGSVALKPTVTVTAGLRYGSVLRSLPTSGVFTKTGIPDLCGPSGEGTGVGGQFCNIFMPGTLTEPDVVPQFVDYRERHRLQRRLQQLGAERRRLVAADVQAASCGPSSVTPRPRRSAGLLAQLHQAL